MPPPRYWEFAQLNSDFKTMGWLDQIPRAGNLHIGGLHALYSQPHLFATAGITHIVSVLDFDVETADVSKQYQYLMLRVEDDPNEILLDRFAAANAFIDQALTSGGGVFVHCAMGKSRSATVVCAYLMWKYALAPPEALRQVCEGRPVCQPNPGFMEQLEVYARMLRARDGEEAAGIYQEWLANRFTGDWWTWDKRGRDGKL